MSSGFDVPVAGLRVFRKSFAERFWVRVNKGAPDECWVWRFKPRTDGYVTTNVRGRRDYVHRVAYVLAHGPVPDGLVVRHSCDVRNCCNPRHLSVGTHADNSADMVLRSRSSRGDRSPSAKLTAADVLKIRSRLSTGEKHREIAKDFGVSDGTIDHISSGRNWGHLK